MKKSAILFFFLLLFRGAFCQSYLVSQIGSASPYPLNGGTPTDSLGDDQWSGLIDMPFQFCFFGTTYDQLLIGSNAIVSFDVTNAGGLTPPNGFCPWQVSTNIPANTLPMNSIMAGFHDVYPPGGGIIKYATYGILPYRKFVISYDSVAQVGCINTRFSAQIVLNETTNKIDIYIINYPVCTTWNMGHAIEGIQNSLGTIGEVVPGRNYPSVWSAQNDAWTFIPFGYCNSSFFQTDTISGRIFTDANLNCIKDANDTALANILVTAYFNGSFYGLTDSTGHYKIIVPFGTYTVHPDFTSGASSTCPSSGYYTVTFNGPYLSDTGINFNDGDHIHDISVHLFDSGFIKCQPSNLRIDYCNTGSYPDNNVSISLQLNDSLTVTGCNAGYFPMQNNLYIVNLGTLQAHQCDSVVFRLKAACYDTATHYCIHVMITGGDTLETNLLNNHDSTCVILTAPMINDVGNITNQNQLSVFPDPAGDHIFIQSGNLLMSRVSVWDACGRKLKDLAVHSSGVSLYTGDLQAGVYLLKVETTDGIIIRKMAKE